MCPKIRWDGWKNFGWGTKQGLSSDTQMGMLQNFEDPVYIILIYKLKIKFHSLKNFIKYLPKFF